MRPAEGAISIVGRISPRPILIVHGSEDAGVPADHALALHRSAGEPKELLIVEGAGHTGFVAAEPNRYPERVLGFLARSLDVPATIRETSQADLPLRPAAPLE